MVQHMKNIDVVNFNVSPLTIHCNSVSLDEREVYKHQNECFHDVMNEMSYSS